MTQKTSYWPDWVTVVPDLSEQGLIDAAKRVGKIDVVSPHYDVYRFITDEREKVYRVATLYPETNLVNARRLRERFREMGYVGNTAAFVSWLAQTRPRQWHAWASIPEDEKCCFSCEPSAPVFFCGDSGTELTLLPLSESRSGFCYVAFQEISETHCWQRFF